MTQFHPSEATAIAFDENTVAIEVAENGVINLVTVPVNASLEGLTVTSSNSEVATVTQDSVDLRKFTISGLSEGSATITASLNNLTATCSVTVANAQVSRIYFVNYGTEVEYTQPVNLFINEGFVCILKSVPADLDLSQAVVTTSDSNVLTLTEVAGDEPTFQTEAIASGAATITATLGELTATINVIVDSRIRIDDLYFVNYTTEEEVTRETISPEETLTVVVKSHPSNADFTNLVVTNSDSSVASIEKLTGVQYTEPTYEITGITGGSTTITASLDMASLDGTLQITVSPLHP